MKRDRSLGGEPLEEPPRPDGTPGRSGWIVVGVALVLFLAIRVPALLLEPELETTEQHEFGQFAVHLVAGPIAPLRDYLPQPHQGCTFLFGGFCAPVIAVLGPTIGSMRTCSLLLHAAIAAVFALLALRAAGLRAGITAAVLMAFGPELAVHLAHKGSTNHDDADLFVGLLLLLVARPPPERGGRLARGLLAGALAGAAAVYMLDGGLRALVVLGAAALLGPRLRSWRDLVAPIAGAAAVLTTAWGLGVKLGRGTVIEGAVTQSFLFGGDGEVAGPAARLSDLISVAIPETFRGAGGVLGLNLSDPLRGWVYLACLGLLITLGIAARALWSSRGDPEAARRRLILVTCGLVVVVQFVAVLASSLDADTSDYTAPLWPWLVVLAATATGRPRPRSRGGAAAWLTVTSLALLLTLATVVQGHVPDFDSRYAGSGTDGPSSAALSRFTRSLTASRPARHPLGPRLVEQRPDRLFEPLPSRMRHDIPAVLRLRGWAAARQLDHASCGAAREQAERDYFTVQHTAIEQAFFWEGVGEALVSRPDWCARPTGPFGPTWTGPVAAALARVTGEDPAAASAALRGLAAGALEETDGVFADLERAFPRGPARRAMCVAAGRWGYLSMRIVELREWLDASHACDEAEVAAGWGQALARDRTVFELPDQRPPFSLWWLHASLRSEEAFVCAWRAEQDNVAALVLGDPAQDPSPIDACLPPLSAPPEERIDGDRPGVD